MVGVLSKPSAAYHRHRSRSGKQVSPFLRIEIGPKAWRDLAHLGETDPRRAENWAATTDRPSCRKSRNFSRGGFEFLIIPRCRRYWLQGGNGFRGL